MERAGFATTLDQGNDLVFGPAASLFRLAFDLALIGFIGFHDLPASAHGFRLAGFHGFADTVRHKPRGLIRHAKGAVQLVATHALLGRAEQVDRHQPLVKRDLGTLEYRPDCHGKWFAAIGAFVKAGARGLAHKLPMLPDHATVRAGRAIGPYLGL